MLIFLYSEKDKKRENYVCSFLGPESRAQFCAEDHDEIIYFFAELAPIQ